MANAASAHRYHLLLLALLGQVLDAVDEKLVGADVGPASFDHPAAQLHQLEEGVKKKKGWKTNIKQTDHFEYTTQICRLFKESHAANNVRMGY